jgi:hypothetical protein
VKSHRSILTVLCSAALLAASTACDNDSPSASTSRPSTAPPATAPDNTARNKVDSSGDTKTPMDQSQSSAGVKLTADIRRAIMEDSTMSVNAQNCKIITDDAGTVTLRGVVDSQAEKDSIAAKAEAVAGAGRVVNELEVRTPTS